jgi:hypothetical protein
MLCPEEQLLDDPSCSRTPSPPLNSFKPCMPSNPTSPTAWPHW